jgi:diguanylate cyclase (GGDEF)-like protein
MGMTPNPTTVDPRVLTGVAALVIAALLLLLYLYRQRHYILFWISGWVLVAASMFASFPKFANEQVAAMAYGVAQFLGIISALVFVISADAYRPRPLSFAQRGRHLVRTYGIVLLPVLLWFTLAPLALGAPAVFAPGHVLIAGALFAAALAHLALLHQARLIGAVMIGITMLGLAASNAWMAFGVPQPNAPVAAHTTFITLGMYLVAALGMQLMTFEDMTYELRVANRELETAQGELRDLVTTDPLTGCRNRRFFHDVIGREIERHKRYNIPLSMVFVDVNQFKAINDTLGHETGDRVLQQVAAFLMSKVRGADYVFRWGGDEFLILMSCGEDEAVRKGAELQAVFHKSSKAAALPQGVGLSVGCAEVPPETRDVMPLVKLADARMYANKREPGGQGARGPGVRGAGGLGVRGPGAGGPGARGSGGRAVRSSS